MRQLASGQPRVKARCTGDHQKSMNSYHVHLVSWLPVRGVVASALDVARNSGMKLEAAKLDVVLPGNRSAEGHLMMFGESMRRLIFVQSDRTREAKRVSQPSMVAPGLSSSAACAGSLAQ